MNYRITRISKGFYSFSIWDTGHLLFVYTGSSEKIKRRAKEFDYDISLKMHILNRNDYKLGYING
tara:strand:- start:938 stop:1132 length:195 start_codon:yes stop_codon:yes gene_type:complete